VKQLSLFTNFEAFLASFEEIFEECDKFFFILAFGEQQRFIWHLGMLWILGT